MGFWTLCIQAWDDWTTLGCVVTWTVETVLFMDLSCHSSPVSPLPPPLHLNTPRTAPLFPSPTLAACTHTHLFPLSPHPAPDLLMTLCLCLSLPPVFYAWPPLLCISMLPLPALAVPSVEPRQWLSSTACPPPAPTPPPVPPLPFPPHCMPSACTHPRTRTCHHTLYTPLLPCLLSPLIHLHCTHFCLPAFAMPPWLPAPFPTTAPLSLHTFCTHTCLPHALPLPHTHLHCTHTSPHTTGTICNFVLVTGRFLEMGGRVGGLGSGLALGRWRQWLEARQTCYDHYLPAFLMPAFYLPSHLPPPSLPT